MIQSEIEYSLSRWEWMTNECYLLEYYKVIAVNVNIHNNNYKCEPRYRIEWLFWAFYLFI